MCKGKEHWNSCRNESGVADLDDLIVTPSKTRRDKVDSKKTGPPKLR
jgi:hypothetical protein